MANSIFTVNKPSEKQENFTFWGGLQWIVFLLSVVITVAFILYNSNVSEQIMTQTTADAIDYRYSVLLLNEKEPQSNIRAVIHSPDALYNEVVRLLPTLQDESKWYAYLIVKSIARNEDTPPSLKIKARESTLSLMNTYENDMPMYYEQWLMLGRDALALEAFPQGAYFYETLLHHDSTFPLYVYQEAIHALSYAGFCEKSALLAFEASDKASTIADKRYFYFEGVRSFFACEQYEKGIIAAKAHLGILNQDPITLNLLAEYALKAGDPAYASSIMFYIMTH